MYMNAYMCMHACMYYIYICVHVRTCVCVCDGGEDDGQYEYGTSTHGLCDTFTVLSSF
jgi:hypothetical protein